MTTYKHQGQRVMLSIVINVKNGAQHLAQCLNALERFEDVVVLDNFSTDDTVAIAKRYSNVNLVEHEFCGMGKVRNLAASFARYDWVFFVDCDEIVTPELADSVLNMQFEDGYLYRVRRYNFYDNRYINASGWGNDWILRIYNRKQNSFADNQVHDSFVHKMPENRIASGILYHFPYDNVEKLINKMQFYSTLYAKQKFSKKRPRLYSIPIRGFFAFVKYYILQGGFTHGYEGLTISAYNAMGVFSKYIKLYELYYKRNLALAIGVSDIKALPQILHAINKQTLLPNLVIVILPSDHDSAINLQQQADMMLKKHLVVSGVVLENSTQSSQQPSALLENYLHTNLALDSIFYLTDNTQLFTTKKLMQQCKSALLANRQQPHGITLINQIIANS